MKHFFFGLLFILSLPVLAGDSSALEVIEFPNVPEFPVPEDLNYGQFFTKGNPAKIVFGVSDPGHQLKESLINAAYTIKYLKPRGIPYQIELVLYGKAILPANSFNEKYAGYAALFNELNNHGVVFSICNNTIEAIGESRDDLYEYMKVIPAGILQITKKQMQGFAYIHNTK